MRAAVVVVALSACAPRPPATHAPAAPPSSQTSDDTLDLHPTPADDLAEARELEATALAVQAPADRRIAWLVAAAGWDRVVADAALPRPALRDAAYRAVYAIRLARAPDEAPTPGAVPTPRVLREVAAIDHHVALLDQPDSPDGLLEQLVAAQLLETWNDHAGARARLEHIVGVRRDLDLSEPAAVLLLQTLAELHDDAGTRSWLDVLIGDPAFARRFPAAADTARREAARLDFQAAAALLDRGDFTGCADAFARLAAAAPDAQVGSVASYDGAICLERAGQRVRAIAAYRDLVAKFPGTPVAEEARMRLVELGAP
jgi:hypothetical protein